MSNPMPAPNWVEIIGYQEEKVHTGILAWVLSEQGTSSPQAKKALGRLFMPNDLDASAIPIEAKREASVDSVGKKVRIDLVLKTKDKGDRQVISVIECKTDSDISLKQLRKSRNAAKKRWPNAEQRCVILAVGAAEDTYQGLETIQGEAKAERREEMGRWNLVTSDDLLQAMSRLDDDAVDPVLMVWRQALRKEQKCKQDIEQHFLQGRPKQAGYRRGLPEYYRYYAALRKHLPAPNRWRIYSGRNNAVMNGLDTWHQHSPEIKTYFELNNNKLYLKAYFPLSNPPAAWKSARCAIVETVGEADPRHGRRASRRKGTQPYASLYRWTFDFLSMPLATVASELEIIVGTIDKTTARNS